MFEHIVEAILKADERLLFVINHDWANPIFDSIFPAITDLHKTFGFKFVFLPAIILYILWSQRLKGAQFLGYLGLVVGLVDWTGGKLIKPLVGRLRPPLTFPEVAIKAPFYSDLSFLSNHAANSFAIAFFVFLYHRKLGAVCLFVATLIGFSRIYCGVHFPFDVIAGAAYGASCALLVFNVQKLISFHYASKKMKES